MFKPSDFLPIIRRRNPSRRSPWWLALGLSVGLAGCSSTSGIIGDPNGAAPTTPVLGQPLNDLPSQDTGNQIGNGPVKVALILPLTQASGPSVLGASMRNSAEMAMSEFPNNELTLTVLDDHSTVEGAKEAAQTAVNDGAELIIGPLYRDNVREAMRVARGAGKPIISFTTDTTVAARGAYLLSFLVETYTDRIIDYAASQGKKSFGILAPNDEIGNVAVAEFQQEASRRGLRVQAIERYSGTNATTAIQRLAANSGQIDAVFIPERPEGVVVVAKSLATAGLRAPNMQLLGIGTWNDARVTSAPALQGAWFSTPDNALFIGFSTKYHAKFNSDPTRLSTLSYDAVTMAIALARMQGSQRYSESVLTNRSGFNGADGLFRFRPDGLNDRGLQVVQIVNNSTQVISPAPRSFPDTTAGR